MAHWATKKEPPGLCRGAVPPRRSRGGNDRRIAPAHRRICGAVHAVARAKIISSCFEHFALRSRLIARQLHRHSFSMPKPELLETFPNPYPGRDYEIAMECPEFTVAVSARRHRERRRRVARAAGRRARFRHDLHHIRARTSLHRAEEPQALSLELSRRRDFLRARGQSHSRRCRQRDKPRWMEVVGDFNIRGGIKSVIRARVGARTAGWSSPQTSRKQTPPAKRRAGFVIVVQND